MGGHPNSIWGADQEVDLTAFITSGMSYSQAAAALNEKFGTNFTRCAATGKGYRLGLSSPPKPRLPAKVQAPKQRRIILRLVPRHEEIQIRCTEIEPRHLTLDQLDENDCRYPYGDGPFTFCGHPKQDGSAYCPAHHAMAHTVARQMTDEDRQRRRMHWKKLQKLQSSGVVV